MHGQGSREMGAESPRSDGFGDLLRQLRTQAGLTQEELAERSGLSVRAIANMECGRTTRPYRHSVQSLSDALQLSGPAHDALVQAARPAPAEIMTQPHPMGDTKRNRLIIAAVAAVVLVGIMVGIALRASSSHANPQSIQGVQSHTPGPGPGKFAPSRPPWLVTCTVDAANDTFQVVATNTSRKSQYTGEGWTALLYDGGREVGTTNDDRHPGNQVPTNAVMPGRTVGPGDDTRSYIWRISDITSSLVTRCSVIAYDG
jgi:Helix-turn-helix domain